MPFADSIEANVENADVHVERGAEQLQRAAYYQVSLCLFLPLFCKILNNNQLSVLSVIAKIQEEDVYSCHSVFHNTYPSYHYYLFCFQVS